MIVKSIIVGIKNKKAFPAHLNHRNISSLSAMLT